jgi:hypothetical protein
MSAVQTIRAKSGASLQKARATASESDDETDDVAPTPDDPGADQGGEHAPPPPGMGKLVDRTV